jgi:exosome complex component RRP41
MDAKLPMDTFETVMELATEGCKAIATYIREVESFFLLFSPVYSWLSLLNSIFLLQVLLENTKQLECQRG